MIYGDYVMGSKGFVREIKLMFKGKKLPEGIIRKKKLRKIYNPDDIIKAERGYYDVSEKELLYKKSRWNVGKRLLIYLRASGQ
jgi:hypothetical protein